MSLAVGLMSGTSMDGIDACLVEIRPGSTTGGHKQTEPDENLVVTLIEFLTKPYPAGVREALFRLCEGGEGGGGGGVAEVCVYNCLLGQLFAEAAQDVVAKAGRSMDDITVIGSHGQTIQHLPEPRSLHGYQVSSTLQIGDPAVIAGLCGVTTVGDFRVADMAAGGQGAPLVPYMDRTLLRSHYQRTGRLGMLLNIGGISNVSVLLPTSGELVAFDCGPGNILIDSLMRRWYGVEFDRDGQVASEGRVSSALLESMMADHREYLHRKPPKSTGREVYGDGCVERIVGWSRELGLAQRDTVATVTAFTASAVSVGYERHIQPRLDGEASSPPRDLLVSGGGARNSCLMRLIQERLPAVRVATTRALGVDPDAKEAMCFALLAHQTVRGVCTNVPSATGARRRAVLGKICPVPHKPDTSSAG